MNKSHTDLNVGGQPTQGVGDGQRRQRKKRAEARLYVPPSRRTATPSVGTNHCQARGPGTFQGTEEGHTDGTNSSTKTRVMEQGKQDGHSPSRSDTSNPRHQRRGKSDQKKVTSSRGRGRGRGGANLLPGKQAEKEEVSSPPTQDLISATVSRNMDKKEPESMETEQSQNNHIQDPADAVDMISSERISQLSEKCGVITHTAFSSSSAESNAMQVFEPNLDVTEDHGKNEVLGRDSCFVTESDACDWPKESGELDASRSLEHHEPGCDKEKLRDKQCGKNFCEQNFSSDTSSTDVMGLSNDSLEDRSVHDVAKCPEIIATEVTDMCCQSVVCEVSPNEENNFVSSLPEETALRECSDDFHQMDHEQKLSPCDRTPSVVEVELDVQVNCGLEQEALSGSVAGDSGLLESDVVICNPVMQLDSSSQIGNGANIPKVVSTCKETESSDVGPRSTVPLKDGLLEEGEIVETGGINDAEKMVSMKNDGESKPEKIKKTKKKDKSKKKRHTEDLSKSLPDNTEEILDSIFTSSVISEHLTKKVKVGAKKGASKGRATTRGADAGDGGTGGADAGDGGGKVDVEVDDWEDLFNDSGDSLDEGLVQELTTAVGKVKVDSPQFDYLDYQPRDPQLDGAEYGHLIEISGFPAEFKTADLLSAFKQFMDRGFDIKWVDDTHAIGIFASTVAADDALQMKNPFFTVCSISMATSQTKVKAKRCTEFLQPYKPRPETTASAARRLVAGALGLNAKVPREKREEERQRLKEAREKKKADRRMKDATWDGQVGKCAMDD